MVKQIQQQKKELSFLRRNIFPVNETIRSVVKIEGKYIRKGTFRYFVDTQDHLIHLVQSLELYRETIANLMELQMANNSNRMNSVMKTLTIISTVFIPLTFLAGVYGMNFEYMPELEIPWAYPALMIFMTLLGFGMFVYMKRRKWF
jgi:magnesium transporter